jgi:hypothetical protein
MNLLKKLVIVLTKEEAGYYFKRAKGNEGVLR